MVLQSLEGKIVDCHHDADIYLQVQGTDIRWLPGNPCAPISIPWSSPQHAIILLIYRILSRSKRLEKLVCHLSAC